MGFLIELPSLWKFPSEFIISIHKSWLLHIEIGFSSRANTKSPWAEDIEENGLRVLIVKSFVAMYSFYIVERKEKVIDNVITCWLYDMTAQAVCYKITEITLLVHN